MSTVYCIYICFWAIFFFSFSRPSLYVVQEPVARRFVMQPRGCYERKKKIWPHDQLVWPTTTITCKPTPWQALAGLQRVNVSVHYALINIHERSGGKFEILCCVCTQSFSPQLCVCVVCASLPEGHHSSVSFHMKRPGFGGNRVGACASTNPPSKKKNK